MSRANRPQRASASGVRNILSVQGKEPGFEYRFVNDVGDRVRQMEEAGYEIVRDKNVKVGDKRVANPTADGTPVQISAGDGVQAYLMRIKKEWYDEDQAAKADRINQIESSMKAEALSQGMYGKLEITRS